MDASKKESFDFLSQSMQLARRGQWDELLKMLAAYPYLATVPDKQKNSLLVELCAIPGANAAVKALIDIGADVNEVGSVGQSAVGNAIAAGNSIGLDTVDILETLLARGANPNMRADAGYPALHWAIVLNKLQHAALLLKFGADPYMVTRDLQPENAFDVARRTGNKKALELLQKPGAHHE